jgi:hypothetical protein
MRIAVRGHIVPSASQLRRRKENRGKRGEATRKRRAAREQADLAALEEGAHQDALAAEKAASWQILSPEEEQEAIKILGPRPWYTLVYDSETVVPRLSDDGTFVIIDAKSRLPVAAMPSFALLRCGQPLRIGYYELRGISEWEVARRLHRGILKPEHRNTLRKAGFVLPDQMERVALANGEAAPLYAGYETVLAADRKAVEFYVATHRYRGAYKGIDITILGKQDFITSVLYKYCYGYGKHIIGARLIGHQLLYDLTRLATDVWTVDGDLVRGVVRGKDWARRGFSLKLCDCPFESCGYHPRIRVAKLGRFKMRYAFSQGSIPAKAATHDGQKRRKRTYTGRFLDTIPFGLALRKCKSAKLEDMGRIFGVKVRKLPHPDFSGPLTSEFLDYLVTDVHTTYWLYAAELEDYHQLGLGRTPESIYSTASLAKGALHAFGFPRAKDRLWKLDLPAAGYSAEAVEGFAATSYFGGRAEVHTRSQIREMLHLDFKSQYVAGSDLMGLQDFWCAKEVTVRDVTAEIRAWLTSKSPAEFLGELRDRKAWRQLPVLVCFRPDGRITLPVRADFQQHVYPSGIKNIGQGYVRSKTPLWYTLGEQLAGIIRDEAVPEIIQALAFVPSVEKVETHPVTIAGRTFDPTQETIWTSLIDVRRERKEAGKLALRRGDLAEAQRLEGQQYALKEIALAGAYGVAEELNEKVYEGKALTLDVYALGHTKRHGNIVEEPGPYFAGVLGTFIPAAGRLLLAICERLLRDQGLTYLFMDTDSVTPIRPAGMSREEFRQRVQTVVDWFIPLGIYADGGSLLDYEDQNYAIHPTNPNDIDKPQLVPLYGVATSAKRYHEFNVHEKPETGEKRPIPRKFTSHGLGQWGSRDQEDYALPDYMDPPHTFRELEDAQGSVVLDTEGHPVRIPDSTALGGPLWVYRLQWDYAYTLLNGHYPNGDPLYIDEEGVPWYYPPAEEWLLVPAFYQFSIETWADYQRVKHLPGMRPGGFITVYPSPEDARDPLSQMVVGDEVVRPDDEGGALGQSSGEEESEEAIAEKLEQLLGETLLTRDSTALYSPYLTTSAEAAQAQARGEICRIGDNTPVPAGTALKTMYEVVLHYFTHGEAKAANPYGVGELARRHFDVVGVDVIDKESNRLAQAAAEDTANVVGGREQFGSRNYGATGPKDTPIPPSKLAQAASVQRRQQLSSLFDEEMPDLLAASCLSRRTLDRATKSDYEPEPETWAALEQAMELLAPSRPESIAGWRDIVTAEKLAELLHVPLDDAKKRFQGRTMWSVSEHEQLLQYLAERRARLTELDEDTL